MKITAGILVYNEEDLIGPCIEGALLFADKIIISDGTMNSSIVDPGQRSDVVEASSDKTRDVIELYSKKYPSKIYEIHMDGLPTPPERDIRNTQYDLCETEYFMIVDSDEIWCKETVEKLLQGIEKDKGKSDSFSVSNNLFFTSPFTYMITKHWRLFKKKWKREFYGNNEMTGMNNKANIDAFFHHYGYLIPSKVRAKMDLYSGTAYRGCGSKWYSDVFIKFIEGASPLELMESNGGTMHPWGLIHPGFAKEEWMPFRFPEIEHPIQMKPLFDRLEYREVRYCE